MNAAMLPSKRFIHTQHRCNNKSSAVAEMGDRLATVDLGRKLGGCAPFLVGSWVPS